MPTPEEILSTPPFSELHEGLRQILRAELTSGNGIRDFGTDWPEPGGILVRLKFPFRVSIFPLPDGISFAQINDPHWWMAEYFTQSPRHTVAS